MTRDIVFNSAKLVVEEKIIKSGGEVGCIGFRYKYSKDNFKEHISDDADDAALDPTLVANMGTWLNLPARGESV